MNDNTLNPNFEWNKKGFGKREKLSRRIDANQATRQENKKKNRFTQAVPLTAQKTPSFDNSLKKMRRKIKQAVEEDEEEEEYFSVIDNSLLAFENEYDANPLFNGLNEKEKKIISEKETIKQIRMQQDVAKIHALATVNAFAKRAGLPQLSPQEMAENIQNNGWENETFKRAVEKYVAPDIKSGTARLNPHKVKKLMAGLKRLQKIGGISAVKGMKMNDVISITDKRYNDERVAKMLLKKTGRKANPTQDRKKERNRHQPKVSFKKLLMQKQKQEQTMKA